MVEVQVISGEFQSQINGNMQTMIYLGWIPHFPVQITNDRGKILYWLTLTREKK